MFDWTGLGTCLACFCNLQRRGKSVCSTLVEFVCVCEINQFTSGFGIRPGERVIWYNCGMTKLYT
jgi:hypothetical protein